MTIVMAMVLGVVMPAETSLPNVQLKGMLGDRLKTMIERHVEAADVEYYTACFKEKTETKRWWQTEFWGKYMHAAVPYVEYTKSEKLRKALDRSIETILASQEEGGYIGNYPDELRCGNGWDVWGIKYTMMGLLHYYDLTRDERTLKACMRLCDYLIGELGRGGKRGIELWQTGNWNGFASSSVLEPVVWLYRRTQEKRYLDFAAYIVEGLEKPVAGPRLVDLALKGISVAERDGHGNSGYINKNGSYCLKNGRTKAYEMMSCYQGLLDYYEVTGREDLKTATIKTAEDIVKTEINLAGGCACGERWYRGVANQHRQFEKMQETCVLTTWMRLCEKLLELTDDPKWADEIERTFYNAYLASLRTDGAEFATYTPLNGNRYHGSHHCYMHHNCCNANGPRGFLCFLREFFVKKDKVATFNFYTSSLVDGFEVYSLYPRSDNVRILSHTEGKLKLRLRIPAWSTKTVVTVNGAAIEGVKSGSYLVIDREWKLGDVVGIVFDMPTVAHRQQNYVAFTRGPILLARDTRFDDGDITEPFVYGRGPRNGELMPTFAAVRSPSDDIWMTFSATLPIGVHNENPEGGLGTAVFFCDFASAGNSWKRKDAYRTWFPIEFGPDEK